LKSRVEKLLERQKKVANQSLERGEEKNCEGNDDPKDGGLALMRAWRGLPKAGPI